MNQPSKWGGTTAQVLALLAEFGPMTRAEICKHLGRDKYDIAAVVSRLNKASKARPKRVYIKAYVYDQEGERRYPRAVFDLGDKSDKKRPKSNVKEIKARYWAKKKMLMRANSVFHLGMSRQALRKLYKEKSCTTSSESTPA
jgi:hypothetical protein